MKSNVQKRKFPDFSRPYSEDKAYLSGDESGEWGIEAENIAGQIAEANAMEQLAVCTLQDLVEEVMELDYLLANIGEDGDEGNADVEEEVGLFETVLINKKTTATELKVICKALALNSSGNKTVLLQRIRDCGINVIDQIDDESFYYMRRRVGEIDTSLLRWIILNPDPAPAVEGIDMLHGAEEGFYGPTNAENAEGAPRFQYCCSEGDKIRRPEFVSKTPNL